MSPLLSLLVAIAIVPAAPAHASFDNPHASSQASRAERVAEAQSIQRNNGSPALQQDPRSSRTGKSGGFGMFDAIAVLPISNPQRSYPPSCLAEPLPAGSIGPFNVTVRASLAVRTSATGGLETENVDIDVWRYPCSSSRSPSSVVLMRIYRLNDPDRDPSSQLLIPDIRISQAQHSFEETSAPFNRLRIASLANTISMTTPVDTPIICDTTYVLESAPPGAGGLIDLNQAFSLRFDNLMASDNRYYLDVPAYTIDPAHPPFSLGMPISKYMIGNWYDPSADGEGLALQIFDNPVNVYSPIISLAWNTFDTRGNPFWLFGQGEYLRGSADVAVTIGWRTGGGFGWAQHPAAPAQIWGTASIRFPDCNHMRFSFLANPGLPSWVPQGAGTRMLQRVADTNAMPCE
jgi:hypothetical protein